MVSLESRCGGRKSWQFSCLLKEVKGGRNEENKFNLKNVRGEVWAIVADFVNSRLISHATIRESNNNLKMNVVTFNGFVNNHYISKK